MSPSSKGPHRRRKLDLNQPGIIFLKTIGFFVVVLPAVLYGIRILWDRAEITSLIRISFTIGAAVFVVLLVLVVVEQIQDYRFDVQYRKNHGRKLPLADGNYECQYCGNQQVKEFDRVCQVCGREVE